MRRWLIALCTMALVISVLVTPAFAARMCGKNAGCGNRTARSSFVDADNDGVCDNKSADKQGSNFVDADNDSVCDNRVSGANCGRGRQGRKNR